MAGGGISWGGAAFLALAFCLGMARPATPELRVTPDLVEIGAFFQGEDITVAGKIPAGAEAVVEVLGPETTESLMRKGRRGGLWMNVGEVEVEHAPSLYLAQATNPELLSATTPEAAFGFPALKKQMTISGGTAASGELEEFLKLKESEDLYRVMVQPLKVSQAAVQGIFHLPTQVKPGTYRVRLSVIELGQVSGQQLGELSVVMVGLPALFFSMAYEHGALYGILAVIIAIVTGIVMGYLFKGGGGH